MNDNIQKIMSIFSYDQFKEILDHIHMNSTYKGVFLYALADLANYDDNDLVGKEWIHQNDDYWTVDLAFPAIRFLRYYWKISYYNIFHMPQKQANFSDPQNDTLNVFKIIREQSNIKKIPDLVGLSKNPSLYKKIINESIRKEMLPYLVKDFNGRIVSEQEKIRLDIELVNIIRENQAQIREDVGMRIYDHLHRLSENEQFEHQIGLQIQENMGPFSKYFSKLGYGQVFLICVDSDEAESIYEQTMNEGIRPDDEEIFGTKNVKLWPIRSTEDNKNIWKEIRRWDTVFFVCDGRCFSKARVKETVQGTKTAQTLWPQVVNPSRDLLIIFESVNQFELDLQDSSRPLINPTVQAEYNFPIVKDPPELKRYIHAIRGGSIEDADGELTEVDVRVVRVQAKNRRGQDKFRKMVLENYCNNCAVCDIDDEKLLEAAHILDVGHTETAGSLDNGICLCVLHHKMFDIGYLYFDDKYKAHLIDDVPKIIKDLWTPSTIDKSSCKILPSREYLRTRRDLFYQPETINGNHVS